MTGGQLVPARAGSPTDEAAQTLACNRRNFGPLSSSSAWLQLGQLAPSATVGGYNGNELTVTGCNVTIASVAMACALPEGFGGPWSWRVKVGEQNSSALSTTMTYDAPVILNVTALGPVVSSGGTEVLLR